MLRLAWLALLLPAATCNNKPGPVRDTDVPTPTTPGPRTINGTLECGEEIQMPAPGQGGLPECVVQQLQCGDVVQGTNAGGTTFYDYTLWQEAMELGALATQPADILDGPEAVYQILGHPPDTEITVTVTSCVQHWVSWRRHGDVTQDWCAEPTMQSEMGHFTGDWQNKSYTLVNRSSGDYDWEIIVDAWDGQTGDFVIEVECFSR